MSLRDRREKLRGLMDRRGLGALLMRNSANFAWYTGGADNRVDHADPLGVAAVLLTTEAEYVLTDNIEAPRMREEETPGFEVVEYPWFGSSQGALEEVTGGATLGTDHPTENTVDISGEISRLRYVLDGDAMERYRRVGEDAVSAVMEAAVTLEPETDEREAVASLVAACRKRGLSSPVAIAAGKERTSRYRHPVSQGAKLGDRAMLVVCGERGGLYANLTRTVLFEEPDPELQRRQQTCDAILLQMQEATVPGRTLAEVFEDCKKFYAEKGFPDEWKKHHQGGLTGYASREVISTPETHLEIKPGMAFAWNPSVVGAKAEETFILTAAGPEVITGG